MMARRWQHQCLEIREAAQALLLAELGRMGAKGRKALVDNWAQYLPVYSGQENVPGPGQSHNQSPVSVSSAGGGDQQLGCEKVDEHDEFEEEELAEELIASRKPSSNTELKRKQTTSVVILGVIGNYFVV